MVLFLLALIVAVVGVVGYAHYNPGVQDITLRTYHFTGVPLWMPLAIAAGAMLVLFFLQAVWSGFRIRSLRRTNSL